MMVLPRMFECTRVIPLCFLFLASGMALAFAGGSHDAPFTVLVSTGVVYSYPLQFENATDAAPIWFFVGANVTGNGTCNYTLPVDRYTGTDSVYIQNSSLANLSITNATAWVSWGCEYSASPFLIWFQMPAVANNCSGDAGFSQDYTHETNTSDQYASRNCQVANPSFTTAYENASGTFGCMASWTCNETSWASLLLSASETLNYTQGANGSVANSSHTPWIPLSLNTAYALLNISSGAIIPLVYEYHDGDFDACPLGWACDTNGLLPVSALSLGVVNASAWVPITPGSGGGNNVIYVGNVSMQQNILLSFALCAILLSTVV